MLDTKFALFFALKILIDIHEKHCSVKEVIANNTFLKNLNAWNRTVTCALHSLAMRSIKAVVTQLLHTNERQNLYSHQLCLQFYIAEDNFKPDQLLIQFGC